MERKELYSFVVGQLEAEGFHDVPSILEAIGANPTSLAEKAMLCKDEKELRELAERTIRKIKLLQAGYAKGKSQEPLMPLKKRHRDEIRRRTELIKNTVDPTTRENQRMELEIYKGRLRKEGYDVDALTPSEFLRAFSGRGER